MKRKKDRVLVNVSEDLQNPFQFGGKVTLTHLLKSCFSSSLSLSLSLSLYFPQIMRVVGVL